MDDELIPAKPRRGRPLSKRKDATMRYIANNKLWDAIAVQCGISTSSIRMWQRVPAARIRDVEAAIGRRASLIRPDLFRRKAKVSNNVTA